MNVNILSKSVKSAWEEARNPAFFGRGDDFAQYVRDVLLTRDNYDLLHKTNDLTENLDDYVTYTRQPDYKFRSKTLGIEFFIEANFRGKFHNQVLEWCKLFQLKRYQEIDQITPVVIVAGVGGRASSPERVFLIPVKHIKFVRLYPGFLNKYEIRPDRYVSEDHLRRILEIIPR
jgi:hypothetical protein